MKNLQGAFQLKKKLKGLSEEQQNVLKQLFIHADKKNAEASSTLLEYLQKYEDIYPDQELEFDEEKGKLEEFHIFCKNRLDVERSMDVFKDALGNAMDALDDDVVETGSTFDWTDADHVNKLKTDMKEYYSTQARDEYTIDGFLEFRKKLSSNDVINSKSMVCRVFHFSRRYI